MTIPFTHMRKVFYVYPYLYVCVKGQEAWYTYYHVIVIWFVSIFLSVGACGSGTASATHKSQPITTVLDFTCSKDTLERSFERPKGADMVDSCETQLIQFSGLQLLLLLLLL